MTSIINWLTRLCRPRWNEDVIEEIVDRYALNLSVLLSETRPSQDEMRQVLETELRGMVDELADRA